MSKFVKTSPQKGEMAILSSEQTPATIFADLKSLFKLPVLMANVLPVFTGFWLALYFSNLTFADHWPLFVLTMLGSTLIVAGALIINNWYDVDIDTKMDRTMNRPTVTGNISLKVVLILGISLSVIGFIFLLFTTIEAAIYGLIGWFVYVVLYTMWSKRRYTLNTVIGSVSGAVTPMIGWTAIDSGFHLVPIVLFMILFIFQMPHTFSIAMKKHKEYAAAKVAMLPVVYGFEMTKRQMVIYIACLLPWPFLLASLGTIFMVIATLMNVGWLAVGISGFFTKDDFKWAHMNFLCSVNYIMILFVMMVIVTLPIFN
ncbi:protoheme IX farnesyltransferase [Cytobacillus eiseniae]|uniref:Protoheme IX farnesyltransferase n=1 Tax=Cytobacillus eiseniae TaxID=762947 RepID=A0ABS4RIE6_9BACI|nr:heme o synthase [Cytobacillus eiseniae]MBP2242680.1 protoheme IX farnesyltransferase [Cytobacillus eiseniae]